MNARTALVTGASSGIGRGLCLRLAREGVEVALVARRAEELERLRAEIEAAGGRARVVPADVSDPAAIEEAVQSVDDALGGLDLVIANAGVGAQGWSGKLTYGQVANLLAVNVVGATATLLAVLPRMVERRRGQIVGVSSLAQYRGLPKSAAYSGSKAYLSTFLEGVRVDLRGTGVAVTDVRPGFVKTPLTATNRNPMPFLLELDDAVERMFRGIAAQDSVVAFPWQLASVVAGSQLLPNALYDRAVGRVRG